MRIRLRWKEHLLIKIVCEHGVTQNEVRQAIWNAPFMMKDRESRMNNPARFKVFSQTDAGRYLKVILDLERGAYTVVTAYDMTENEKRVFKKKRSR